MSEGLTEWIIYFRAKLTLDNAAQHLYHFCATLPADPYVDLRPTFNFVQTYNKGPVRGKHLSSLLNFVLVSFSIITLSFLGQAIVTGDMRTLSTVAFKYYSHHSPSTLQLACTAR